MLLRGATLIYGSLSLCNDVSSVQLGSTQMYSLYLAHSSRLFFESRRPMPARMQRIECTRSIILVSLSMRRLAFSMPLRCRFFRHIFNFGQHPRIAMKHSLWFPSLVEWKLSASLASDLLILYMREARKVSKCRWLLKPTNTAKKLKRMDWTPPTSDRMSKRV